MRYNSDLLQEICCQYVNFDDREQKSRFFKNIEKNANIKNKKLDKPIVKPVEFQLLTSLAKLEVEHLDAFEKAEEMEKKMKNMEKELEQLKLDVEEMTRQRNYIKQLYILECEKNEILKYCGE